MTCGGTYPELMEVDTRLHGRRVLDVASPSPENAGRTELTFGREESG
jgi:hypothetical protein